MKNFEILSGDTLTAIWFNGILSIRNHDLLPLFLKREPNVHAWLASRAADRRRPNIRLLKKALRLAEKDDVSTVIHVYGATITDN